MRERVLLYAERTVDEYIKYVAHTIKQTTGRLGKNPRFAYKSAGGNVIHIHCVARREPNRHFAVTRHNGYTQDTKRSGVKKEAKNIPKKKISMESKIGKPKNPTGTSESPCVTKLRGCIQGNIDKFTSCIFMECVETKCWADIAIAVSSGLPYIEKPIRGMRVENKIATMQNPRGTPILSHF